MERMKSFLLALVLFWAFVMGLHCYAGRHITVDEGDFAAWTNESKSLSYYGLTENMGADSLPVFGSSEFQHGDNTPYHPAKVFQDSGLHPVLIGAGYYQSLSHAITLAAIEESMIQRKAVLILSPQWFRKTGVVNQAYASRFSELLYDSMLKNENLSDETKRYISDRTHHLLAGDESVLNRTVLAENVLFLGDNNRISKGKEYLWQGFLRERDRVSISLKETAAGLSNRKSSLLERHSPDWEALMEQALEEGRAENDNEFFINRERYEKLKPYLPQKEGMNADADKGYQTGPEFDDLKCFLSVCQETGIEPLIVLVPVNGYYYDFTRFPRSARDAYYEKIRNLLSEFGAGVVDLSDQEYTRYFFEDRVHLGKVGWCMVSKAIWEFGSLSSEENE